MTTVDLEAIVRSVFEDFQRPAEEKNLVMELKLQANRSIVLGDALRLQQIVRNLISNAVKFTPRGGRVTVRLTPVGSRLQLSVRDTGPGIKPEFLPYSFDPFRQAERVAVSNREGFGVRLNHSPERRPIAWGNNSRREFRRWWRGIPRGHPGGRSFSDRLGTRDQ